jgi:hypothetical protein
LTDLDDILQLLLPNLRCRQIQLSAPNDLLLLFELLDLGFSCSDELLSLVRFAFTVVAFALLVLFLLLLDLLATLAFGSSQSRTDRSSKDL